MGMVNQMCNTISMQPGSMHPGSVGQVSIPMGSQMNTGINTSVSNINMQATGPRMNATPMSTLINSGPIQSQMSMQGQIPNNMSGTLLASPMSGMNSQMGAGQIPPNMGGGMQHNQMNIHMTQRKVIIIITNLIVIANVPLI